MATEMGSNPRSLQLLPFWMLTTFRLTTVGHSQVDRSKKDLKRCPTSRPELLFWMKFSWINFCSSAKNSKSNQMPTPEKKTRVKSQLCGKTVEREIGHEVATNTMEVETLWTESRSCWSFDGIRNNASFPASTFWFRQISHNWTDHGNQSTFEWWL